MRFFRLTAAAALLAVATTAHAAPAPFRPPAVPLIASDPFMSIWSESDTLNGSPTRHWTQSVVPLTSLIRIDGKTFRLMGDAPRQLPAFPQTGVRVLPTRSIYDFEDTGVHVTLTFMTPSLPTDIDVLSRPITYLTWDVRATDGQKHTVSVLDSIPGLMAVNTPEEVVTWSQEAMGPLTAQKIGTVRQKQLGVSGDGTRRDWGYACLVASTRDAQAASGSLEEIADAFENTGAVLAGRAKQQMPRAANDSQPTLAVSFAMGSVGDRAVSRHAMVGYDEAVQYQILRPDAAPLLAAQRDAAGDTVSDR